MNQFDVGVCREGTDCEKWDSRAQSFGRVDVIPLSVADMDFAAPEPVLRALEARVRHGAFGYTHLTEADYQAVVRWMKRRHGVDVEREWIRFSPGVIDSMRVAIGAFTRPGDGVVVMEPVYGPFESSVRAEGRVVKNCPLRNTEDGWQMDLDAVEDALKAGAKAALLCNPHNPVGRVWTRAELEALSRLTHRYGAALIADEIHADLEMPGWKNTSIVAVDPDAIALISATKTFNLAALRNSTALIPDKAKRDAFTAEFARRGVNGLNLFGGLAQRVAYNEGEPWLDELLAYLDGTRRYVEGFLAERLPMIRPSRLMGTYLMWLDMRALGMPQDELARFIVQKAGLGMISGTAFGEAGAGYMRMCLATPRRRIEQAMERLEKAVKAR